MKLATFRHGAGPELGVVIDGDRIVPLSRLAPRLAADMIDLIARLKVTHRLKIAVVSNEGRELNVYRIQKFKLARLVDLFVSSCFVQVRKPDEEMFRLAMDIAQVQPRNVVYIDNTEMFVEIAQGLGIRSVPHTDYQLTRSKLSAFGLSSG